MAKITYTNKVTLNPQPSIADENKVTDDNMNEIKQVVNTNDDTVQGIINGEKYSTTEVKTNKTWIDGKPIYRKVIDFGQLPSSNSNPLLNHNIGNIDKIVYNYAFCYNSDGITYEIPHVGNTSMMSGVYMAKRVNKEWVQIFVSGNMSSYHAYFILEYTKTTD